MTKKAKLTHVENNLKIDSFFKPIKKNEHDSKKDSNDMVINTQCIPEGELDTQWIDSPVEYCVDDDDSLLLFQQNNDPAVAAVNTTSINMSQLSDSFFSDDEDKKPIEYSFLNQTTHQYDSLVDPDLDFSFSDIISSKNEENSISSPLESEFYIPCSK